ncbi:MAG: histidine kinase [Chloroflexota bacterium]
MNGLRAFLRSFMGLRGKLTLTYTVVTVSALVVIEILGIAVVLLLTYSVGTPEQEYFRDVIYVLYPRAAPYLETDPPDVGGLQNWLDSTYEAGYASAAPTGWSDSAAAPIADNSPFYVLSSDGTVLAAAPQSAAVEIGEPYTPPNVEGSERMLDFARQGLMATSNLYAPAPDGTYYVVVPVMNPDRTETLGIMTLYVEPPPPWLLTIGPQILTAVLVTALVLTIAIVPFGALFGFIMSRGLTGRLKSLSKAADAWSQGNFAVMPRAQGRDELGDLQDRLINMANQLQSLLQTQQELVAMEERNRLARELHDTVKQQIFAAVMQLRAAKNLANEGPDAPHKAISQRLDAVEELLKASQHDLATIINEMRPAALEGRSLVAALRSHLETWSQHTGIKARMQVEGQRSLPTNVERALYRVVQEALANTARHSRATRASLKLRYTQDYVTLALADDGVGFDTTQPETVGFGLQSIRQRISELGGTLSITSKPGKGATLWAEVPLQRRLE